MPTRTSELIGRASVLVEAAQFGRIAPATAREYRVVADRIQAARIAAGATWQGPKSIAPSHAYQTVCRAAWARRTHLELATALRDLRDDLASIEDVARRLEDWIPEAEACPPMVFHFKPNALARRVGRPNKIEQPRKSKRYGIRQLPFDWMDRIWKLACGSESRHLDALAVTLSSGCRPVELTTGAGIRRVADGLEVEIMGAKVSGNAGQAWRRLTVADDGHGPVAHLLELADAAGGEASVRMMASPAAFSMAVTSLGERMGLERRVSPFDIRHRRCADARLAFEHDLEKVAAWLGHRGTEVVRFYGRSSTRGAVAGAVPVDAVAAYAVRTRARSVAQPENDGVPA